mmetsp:Transcript_469/g.596  ORF Transcript_469/g.596 Transcript_469/m.596 type:complete len:460 (-) Transcript_469:117-1496(-)
MSEPTKRARDDDVIESADATEKKSKTEESTSLSIENENGMAKLLSFYFSDSNLRKDKFLKTEQSKNNGYVRISVLLTFNKLKAITTNPNDIIKVCRHHNLLNNLITLNETDTCIKRITPLSENDDSPLRTVYIDGYNISNNNKEPEIDDIKKIFSQYGEILMVRKRRGNGVRRDEPKKFIGSVFIEYKDIISAQKACEKNEIKIEIENEKEPMVLKVLMLNQWLEKNQKARDDETIARNEVGTSDNKTENNENGTCKETESSEPVYDCGKILKLINIPTDIEIDRFIIKDYFQSFGSVKYVDFNNGDIECFIRYNTCEEASNALKNINENDHQGLLLSLLMNKTNKEDEKAAEEKEEEEDNEAADTPQLPLALMPRKSYANAGGIWFLPNQECLRIWLTRAHFKDIEIFYADKLSTDEQRATEWADIRSLQQALDPKDMTRTIEGYPAPHRFYLRATRG